MQIVLHPVVDLTNRRVLGDELTVSTAQLGEVSHQQHRPGGHLLPDQPRVQRNDSGTQGGLFVLDVGLAQAATLEIQTD